MENEAMRELKRIILHCSATPEGREVTVDEIRKWHKRRKFKDIGYHFVIDLEGNIHKGRRIEEVGAHTKGENRDSIGICYVGGCDEDLNPKDTLNAKQAGAFVLLVTALRRQYGHLTIHGHNEFANKACPSFDVKQKFGWLDE